MKTPPFLLIGCPLLVIIGAVVYFTTFRELHHTPFHAALLQAETPAGGHLRAILAQLDLSDAQNQQIEQIRQTISDHTQRRQAIVKILTADQRAKYLKLRDEQRKEEDAAEASTNSP